jgi:hypothetical protein
MPRRGTAPMNCLALHSVGGRLAGVWSTVLRSALGQGAGFENDVHRGLGRATEVLEARFLEHVS